MVASTKNSSIAKLICSGCTPRRHFRSDILQTSCAFREDIVEVGSGIIFGKGWFPISEAEQYYRALKMRVESGRCRCQETATRFRAAEPLDSRRSTSRLVR